MSTKYDTQTTAEVVVQDLAPQIAGKVVLTTGVTRGGIGGNFVEFIAKAKPALLILAGRSTEKIKAVKEAVSAQGVATKHLIIDLGSFVSVKSAAATVQGWSDVPAIDVLVNNAGIMASDYALTVDGFEQQYAVNYLGPWLFTNLIMTKVLASKEPRVVSITSDGHRLSPMRWSDLDFHKGENYDKWRAYGQAKTAQMLMTLSLAKSLGPKGLTAVSLHPGVVGGTNLGTHIKWETEYMDLVAIDKQNGNKEGWSSGFDFKSPERGAATHVWASFAPELKANNGAYIQDCHIADPAVDTIKPWGTSPLEAEMLWALSEKQVGARFTY